MLHAVQTFDDLLLLKSGGLVTYHGSLGKRSCKLIEYFQVRALPAKAPMTPYLHELVPCCTLLHLKPV